MIRHSSKRKPERNGWTYTSLLATAKEIKTYYLTSRINMASVRTLPSPSSPSSFGFTHTSKLSGVSQDSPTQRQQGALMKQCGPETDSVLARTLGAKEGKLFQVWILLLMNPRDMDTTQKWMQISPKSHTEATGPSLEYRKLETIRKLLPLKQGIKSQHMEISQAVYWLSFPNSKALEFDDSCIILKVFLTPWQSKHRYTHLFMLLTSRDLTLSSFALELQGPGC